MKTRWDSDKHSEPFWILQRPVESFIVTQFFAASTRWTVPYLLMVNGKSDKNAKNDNNNKKGKRTFNEKLVMPHDVLKAAKSVIKRQRTRIKFNEQ